MYMEKLKRILTDSDYKQLINGNVTFSDILTSTTRELHLLLGLPYTTIRKIVSECSHIVGTKFVTASEIPSWSKLSTGCDSINAQTEGGISLIGINEIVGCSGVGKTQLCLQLSIMSQLPPELGGLSKGVVYINTDGSFPSTRFHELVYHFKQKFNLDSFDPEKNLFLQHIANFKQMKHSLYVLLPNLLKFNNIGLIIIDSIAGIFRSENINVVYTNRSWQFLQIIKQLNNLQKNFNIGVICVNQVTENTQTMKVVPALGLSWSNLVNSRFYITRFEGTNTRKFEIMFSTYLPNNTCNFVVETEGVC